MEYFGIIRFRRTRSVHSKTKGTNVNVYDYIIETLNSDSGQNYAFSVNEEKKKALEAQGMVENALGTMYFYSKSRTYTDRDGQERDVNNTFPQNFKPYATNAPKQPKMVVNTANNTSDMQEEGGLPF